MPVTITGLDKYDDRSFMTVPELVAAEAQKVNVSRYTTVPLRFDAVASKLGDIPALLFLWLKGRNHSTSVAGIKAVVDVIAGIASGKPVSVSSLNFREYGHKSLESFSIASEGFLAGELLERNGIKILFVFSPEAKYSRALMKDGAKGNYYVDLEIKLYVCTPQGKTALLACAVVEFDGPDHLVADTVRDDKIRDSLLLRLGCVPFRIQTLLKVKGVNSTQINRTALAAHIQQHIDDIKEHFRCMLYRAFNTNSALSAVFDKEKESLKN